MEGRLRRTADQFCTRPSKWGIELFHLSRYRAGNVGTSFPSPLKITTNHFARPCRQGFTSRCEHSLLFGSPALEGGQAQYVRVPYAGGTLFRLDDIEPHPVDGSRLTGLADSSLLLLADILPTGYFAALQLLQHPKLLPLLSGNPYPCPTLALDNPVGKSTTAPRDALKIALIGLGPVGIVRSIFLPSSKTTKRNWDPILQCASVSLFDLLWKNGISHYKIIAIDPHEQRRKLIKTIYSSLLEAKHAIDPQSTFDAVDIDTSKNQSFSADKVGFDGVIEVNLSRVVVSLKRGLLNLITGRREHFCRFARFRSRASVRCHNVRRGAPRPPPSGVWSSVIWKKCVARLWTLPRSVYLSPGDRFVGQTARRVRRGRDGY